MTWAELLFIFAAALGSATGALWLVSRAPRAVRADNDPSIDGAALLFTGSMIEHSTPAGRSILSSGRNRNDVTATDWTALYSAIHARFSSFPESPELLPEGQSLIVADESQDPGVLRLERDGEMARVEIVDDGERDAAVFHRLRSVEAEVQVLGAATASAPYPIWLTTNDGRIRWYNDAYEAIYTRARKNGVDPDVPLFTNVAYDGKAPRHGRACIEINEGTEALWYDVIASRTDEGTMFHAVDINAVIRAEVAQRNFVQTLAKTFAQLSIGLAIFDRKGQLALFNPALVDLTALPAEVLSSRPDLLTFFDRLRDNRVMPEPKNYTSWRQEISNVISAATDGRYQETWTLDTGQTYRVSGRPHPDGAIAFLIEDISAEVSLTRNFRAELELGQSLMDTFDEGLVVFSSAGTLTFCNAAYREMWKIDPERSFADITILDSLRVWQSACRPDPAWGDIRDFVMRIGDRASWETQLTWADGRVLVAKVAPIASGATMIRFECPEMVQTEMRLEQHT